MVLLTHYTLGTATKPVGKTSCYRCFCSYLAVKWSHIIKMLIGCVTQKLQLSKCQLFFLRLEMAWQTAAY